ncbi:DEAD/DEAH box helicase [Kroppenstedtia eburnea]|uniref:DEAD/DEAH box helicase n=1 Tax=Kroppenstedtia eburnea TaxID=714067 RepID=UPI00363FF5E9
MIYPAGSRVQIRGEEWLVQEVQPTLTGHDAVRVVGLSEVVRDHQATFLTSIDDIDPLRPEDVRFEMDPSPGYRRTKLFLNALMMRTPILGSDVTTRGQAAMDDSDYQYVPAQVALERLRPRILIADGVGLGKTIEAGVLLSELIRRGRGRRVLVVAPRSMLEQLQKEMWTRFSIPLMRLDSIGIARIRREIPQNKNPFHYYDKVIISIDTLKNDDRYRHFLENCTWDAVWIDESHNVANQNTDRNRLATLLAHRTHSLILTSATPHNGKPESFATLLRMLDPTSVANPEKITPEEVQHLVVRRFKNDVLPQTPGFKEVHDVQVECPTTPEEDQLLIRLGETLVHAIQSKKAKKDALFSVTLLKAFLSSPAALSVTLNKRIQWLERQLEEDPEEETIRKDWTGLKELQSLAEGIPMAENSKYRELKKLLQEWNWRGTPDSPRVILFSERIDTLEALRKQLIRDYGLDEEVVTLFTARMPDTEQMEVVRSFNEESSPIRILLASDVASEGVNLHHRCHHMVHFDVPWSFIRLQQRNGRIDRFGQLNTPEIRYLILKSEDPIAGGETRVVEKLLEKSQLIQRNLGDPSRILKLFDAKEEEDYVKERIAEGDSLDDIFGDDDEDDWDEEFDFVPRTTTHVSIRQQELPRMYRDWLELMEDLQTELQQKREEYRRKYGREDLHRKGEKIRIDREKQRITVSVTPDLESRLRSLPPEAKKKKEIHLTTDPNRVMRSIRMATGDGEWPGDHLLWDIHPVADWVADRALDLIPSRVAPTITLPFLEEGTYHYLIQAQALTESGHPALAEWLVVEREEDHFRARPFMGSRDPLMAEEWYNSGDHGLTGRDLDISEVVACARDYVQQKLQQHHRELEGRIQEEKERLEKWYRESIAPLQERQGSLLEDPKQAARLHRIEMRRHQVESTYQFTRDELDKMLKFKGDPVLRVCARFMRG